ncbi:MAG: Rpn family recombination-promoting nuclease/putative transposase [Bacteroidaceae bacterium]|nr:Rpn family recombination-promoting nuclease/putative transposase [Bacteroidaceae bacterium]
MKNHEFKFIDLRIDWAFKYVYGSPGNEDLLLSLIDAILPEKHISKVELRQQEQIPDNHKQRRSVFDVNCTTQNGESLIIEMQNAEQGDFANRMVYYSGFPIRQQVRAGERKYKFDPVYVIGIMDFIMPGVEPNDRVINRYSIRNDEHPHGMLFDDLHLITIELPKLGNDPGRLNALEKQLYVIQNAGRMSARPNEFSSKNFDKLFGVINFASMSEEDQEMYESELRWILNRNSELDTALDKGIRQGREEGKFDAACKMKAANIAYEVISQCTGLTLEQISEL